MREYIDIYHQYREKVEDFIEDTFHNNIGHISELQEDNYDKLFQTFRSLELVYVVNAKTKLQTSPNIFPNKIDEVAKDVNRSYLINRLRNKENGFSFTTPYKSSATQNLCVTVSKQEGDDILLMDFNLTRLLERLGLIEKNAAFSGFQEMYYTIVGFFMMLISFAAILYAGINFFESMISLNISIRTIFKPIIAATLGLAIFDLAKTVLEQEVFYKSYKKDGKGEVKVLTKFLFTILIALAIETLMVVFKIAMNEDGQMINALYLMGGISLIIFALSVFIYLTGKKN
ncbi:MAG: hypothetical protein IE885_08895 [Campylobacterales bacterium]|nr:hypothetical protein [Campylobacterales bacterium]